VSINRAARSDIVAALFILHHRPWLQQFWPSLTIFGTFCHLSLLYLWLWRHNLTSDFTGGHDMQTNGQQSRTSNVPFRRRLLRTKEAAEYLAISAWKLRRLIQDGRLPVVQDGEGAPFLLDLRDLDSYIDRNKRIASF